MGGYGTWGLAALYPEKFAAIAPICGVGDAVEQLDSLVNDVMLPNGHVSLQGVFAIHWFCPR